MLSYFTEPFKCYDILDFQCMLNIFKEGGRRSVLERGWGILLRWGLRGDNYVDVLVYQTNNTIFDKCIFFSNHRHVFEIKDTCFGLIGPHQCDAVDIFIENSHRIRL